MNLDLSQVQAWVTQFIDAIKSGNLAAIGVAVLAGFLLWRKFKGVPATPVPPVVPAPTISPATQAALLLLDSEPKTTSEKALVAAVAEKHGAAAKV